MNTYQSGRLSSFFTSSPRRVTPAAGAAGYQQVSQNYVGSPSPMFSQWGREPGKKQSSIAVRCLHHLENNILYSCILVPSVHFPNTFTNCFNLTLCVSTSPQHEHSYKASWKNNRDIYLPLTYNHLSCLYCYSETTREKTHLHALLQIMI